MVILPTLSGDSQQTLSDHLHQPIAVHVLGHFRGWEAKIQPAVHDLGRFHGREFKEEKRCTSETKIQYVHRQRCREQAQFR